MTLEPEAMLHIQDRFSALAGTRYPKQRGKKISHAYFEGCHPEIMGSPWVVVVIGGYKSRNRINLTIPQSLELLDKLEGRNQ